MRWPPHWPDYENFFTGDFIWKGACFAIFQQELQNSTMFDGLLRFQISEKWTNLRFPLNIKKQKVFQLQGSSPIWPPDQGLCPWTPLGALPPDSRYRLALHALVMAPFCQVLNTPLRAELQITNCESLLTRILAKKSWKPTCPSMVKSEKMFLSLFHHTPQPPDFNKDRAIGTLCVA